MFFSGAPEPHAFFFCGQCLEPGALKPAFFGLGAQEPRFFGLGAQKSRFCSLGTQEPRFFRTTALEPKNPSRP